MLWIDMSSDQVYGFWMWERHVFMKVSIGSFHAIWLWENESIKITLVASDRNISNQFI